MAIVLDTTHPAYPYIQKVWPFKEGTGTPQELIGSTNISVDAGSFTWVLEASGYGIKLTTADIIGLGVDLFPTAPDVTIVLRRRKTDGTLRFKCPFGYAGDTAGVTRRCSALLPADSGAIIFDFGGNTSDISRLVVSGQSWDTTLDTFVLRVNGSEIRLWRNGSDIGHTAGGAPPTRVNNGTNAQLNNGDNNSGGDNQFVDLFALYTGALTDAMCASISASPADIFLTIMLAGSASIDVAATADLTIGINLSSTATVAVAAAADLTTGINLSGTADMAIAAAADLNAGLQGTASVAVAATADLSTGINVSGTAAIAVAAEAELEDNAALVLAMMIAAAVGSPLILQMDIVGVDVGLDALLLELDILESVRDALLLTIDIAPQALHTSEDVQAPVAEVVLA